jgi:hypothetical protein
MYPIHTFESYGVIAGLHVLPTKHFQVADEEVKTTIW